MRYNCNVEDVFDLGMSVIIVCVLGRSICES